MAFFMVSPGVQVVEIDLTGVIPAVSTAIGALAGDFNWGPVLDITSISSKQRLVSLFGKPTDENYQYFFSADSYLNYSTNLRLVRTDQEGSYNAVAGGTSSPNMVKIKNETHHDIVSFTSDDGYFAAKYPGTLGNSLKITYCLADNTAFEAWEDSDASYKQYFSSAPGTSEYCEERGVYNDEIHIVIIDEDGLFSGTPGTILERFEYLSLNPNAIRSDGTNSYFATVLEMESDYVYWIAHDPSLTSCNAGRTDEWIKINTTMVGSPSRYVYYDPSASPTIDAQLTYSFDSGVNGDPAELDELMEAYDLFKNTTQIDVTLIIAGSIPTSFSDAVTYYNYLIDLAENRHDCITLLSPPVTGTWGSVYYDNPEKVIELTDEVTSSSFGVMDSCALKVYDQYNGVYRWIPANGTIAGLCAHTDAVADPWYSPAGYNRGQIRNIAKISYNPDQLDRDDLYKARINPIVQFPGEGTILYGDKTLLARPSAFDRINVRRLFNVLEKAISTYSKYLLFEFNDEFTRARFVNLVEPYLREVKGRRGLYDFKVVCDTSNNTPQIIDSNEFVGDIYLQPARSINFIRLNFIATPTGVNFEEYLITKR